jgi:O-antigen/teichoic acid export membrane protein
MLRLFDTIRKSEFFSSVATLITGSTIAQLIALAIYPILSKIYTPEEHGLFSLYMGIIAFTGIASTGSYHYAVLMPREDKRAVNLAGLSALIAFFLSVLLLLVVLFFRQEAATLLNNPGITGWLWFVPLSTLLIGIFQASLFWSNRNKRFRATAAANLTQSIINSGVKLSTSRLIPGGGGLITGAIVGQVAGALYFIVRWFTVFRNHLRDLSWKGMGAAGREYYRFPGFNMPNNLINNISNSLPIFLLSAFFGAESVGLYGLGFAMIFRPMSLVVNSVEQVFAQRIIKKFNDGLPVWRDVRILMLRSFQFGLVPFVLAGIFGPLIFRVVFGDAWEESGRMMQILIPWFFTAFIANQLTFLPDLFNRQRKSFVLNLIRLVLRIAGMAVGIVLEDLYLTLVCFSAASFLVVIATLLWYRNMLRDHDRKAGSA